MSDNKTNGRKKCDTLKRIRKIIADANNIPYEIEECTYEGECLGTCPKCESEVRYLNAELEKLREAGKQVRLADFDEVEKELSRVREDNKKNNKFSPFREELEEDNGSDGDDKADIPEQERDQGYRLNENAPIRTSSPMMGKFIPPDWENDEAEEIIEIADPDTDEIYEIDKKSGFSWFGNLRKKKNHQSDLMGIDIPYAREMSDSERALEEYMAEQERLKKERREENTDDEVEILQGDIAMPSDWGGYDSDSDFMGDYDDEEDGYDGLMGLESLPSVAMSKYNAGDNSMSYIMEELDRKELVEEKYQSMLGKLNTMKSVQRDRERIIDEINECISSQVQNDDEETKCGDSRVKLPSEEELENMTEDEKTDLLRQLIVERDNSEWDPVDSIITAGIVCPEPDDTPDLPIIN